VFAGFPAGAADRRDAVLGSFGPATAGGAVRLILRTVSRAGKGVVEAEVEGEPNPDARPRTLVVRFAVEAAAVDAFVADLVGAAVIVGARATLAAA
jgi:hypothetical protein